MNLVYAKKISAYDVRQISDFIDMVFRKENVYAEASKRSSVLLKPNLLSKPTKDCDFVTTNRVVVEAVVMLLLENKIEPSRIVIGDGASAINKNMDAIFYESGMTSIADRFSLSLVNFNVLPYTEKMGIKLSNYLDSDPYIINLAKLKTHMLTKLTLSVKNLYGLLPSAVKLSYHSQFNTEDSFCRLLSKIYKAVMPAVNIVDGIVSMEGNGPGSGEKKDVGIIACSRNGFALDSFIGDSCGFKKGELLFVKHGIIDNLFDGKYALVGDNFSCSLKKPTRNAFTLPLTLADSRFARHLLTSYPLIINDTCRKCMKCMSMCPEGAITLKEGYPFVRKRECVACYCCVEVCPYKSIKTKKSFLEKVKIV
ncbi:MAG: DUF362 domain-containing protein [bacterium]|nr:DUF362 domain-containing protein [bacterium]